MNFEKNKSESDFFEEEEEIEGYELEEEEELVEEEEVEDYESEEEEEEIEGYESEEEEVETITVKKEEKKIYTSLETVQPLQKIKEDAKNLNFEKKTIIPQVKIPIIYSTTLSPDIFLESLRPF